MDGGASVVWALVWNSGTCRPDGTAGQWSGRGLRLVVWSENPKQQICEGESSDAGHTHTFRRRKKLLPARWQRLLPSGRRRGCRRCQREHG